MNNTIDNYISELLFLHDCVILPDFGGFVGNHKSSQLNTLTGTLTPPTKEILFNVNLKTNDGLLITYLSNKENISQNTAKEKVTKFINSIHDKLSKSKILRIEKVGLLTLGKEGKITFIQDKTVNYNLLSFGMKPTYNKQIARNISDTLNQTSIKKINYTLAPKQLLKIAAIIVPLIVLSYFSISQEDNINQFYKQMSSLNLFEENDISRTVITNSRQKTNSNSISPKIIKDNLQKEIVPKKQITEIVNKQKYYIIGGVFSDKKNAKRLLMKLNKWNYNATIIEENDLMRVCYESYQNKDDAIIALNKIKHANSEAWLLTK